MNELANAMQSKRNEARHYGGYGEILFRSSSRFAINIHKRERRPGPRFSLARARIKMIYRPRQDRARAKNPTTILIMIPRRAR